jgi:hypothetical protein
MKVSLFLFVALSVFILTDRSFAQVAPSGIDDYMETGKTIFIAKCAKVGPVNILLRAIVDLEVIHVVKGAKLPAKISVLSHVGMEEGKTYLLRSENVLDEEFSQLTVTKRDSVVQIMDHEDMAKLLSLPPPMIVLRTMNTRIYHLETNSAF